MNIEQSGLVNNKIQIQYSAKIQKCRYRGLFFTSYNVSSTRLFLMEPDFYTNQLEMVLTQHTKLALNCNFSVQTSISGVFTLHLRKTVYCLEGQFKNSKLIFFFSYVVLGSAPSFIQLKIIKTFIFSHVWKLAAKSVLCKDTSDYTQKSEGLVFYFLNYYWESYTLFQNVDYTL